MWIRDPVLLHILAANALDVNELASVQLHLGPSDANLLPGTVGTGRDQALQVLKEAQGHNGRAQDPFQQASASVCARLKAE